MEYISTKNTTNLNDREKLENLFTKAEQKQAKKSFFQPLTKLWQQFINFLSTSNELQIWQSEDRYGNTQWNAYDPATGRSTSLNSDVEMRAWIEQRYY